jgi:hypothetical protein
MTFLSVVHRVCTNLYTVTTVNHVATLKVREGTDKMLGTVFIDRQTVALDDAIGSHACSREAPACV